MREPIITPWILSSLVLALIGSVLLVACGGGGADRDAAAATRELLATDRAFSDMSEVEGAQAAFLAYAAPEAWMLPDGAEALRGRDAIRRAFDGFDATLTWTPVHAEVSDDGTLGYTWGRYRSERTDADGETRISEGKYVSIWRRQGDGSWRWILDTGNESPTPMTPHG